MGRRDRPDAEKKAKRAQQLKNGAGTQDKLDQAAIGQYTQTKVIAARTKDAKAIGFGMVGGMVDKRVNIIAARPFAHVQVLGGHTAETHASGKLEPWGNTAPWIAERGYDVWDTGLQDHQLIGEAWSEVLPAPQFSGEYGDLVEEWKRLLAADEDRAEIKEKMRVYRRDHFPIVWRYVDPTSAYPDPDEEGPMAEVYEFRKLSRGTIEERFPNVTLRENQEDFDVIEYANDVWVATIFPGSGGIFGVGKDVPGFLSDPWEHEMGINPYVRIKRGPMRANTEGYTRTGCSFQVREMSDSLDESATDWRTGMHREAKSPLVYKINAALRSFLNLPNKEIKPDKAGNITLYSHKDYGTEEVERGPTPTVNEQLGQYIGMIGSQADRSGAFIPQFMGSGPAGESAVHGAHSRESAITGELEMGVRHLEEGFAAVVERHFRCVIALDKKLPEGADKDMRKVVVVAEDSKHGAKEIAVVADDVKNHERRIRGKIQKNLPVNMGLNVQNFLQLTDEKNPKIDDNQGRERFLNDPNPQETEERLFQQRLRRAQQDAYVESYAMSAKLIVDEFSEEKMAKIAEKMMKVPGALQQAVLREMGAEDGSRLMANMDRGAANVRGTGVPQGLSQLQGMPQEEPFRG